MNEQIIEQYEIKMWEAAKNRDAEGFLEVVDRDAEMICGGYRCSGAEYAEIIRELDVSEYEISEFQIVAESQEICKVSYVIVTTVADERNKDLEGKFRVTSIWKRIEDNWKLIFNMDSRVN